VFEGVYYKALTQTRTETCRVVLDTWNTFDQMCRWYI